MGENKKILNTNPQEYNGIKFKSTLEVRLYKSLLLAGFIPLYEQRTFIIWEGFKPTIPFYTKERKLKSRVGKSLMLQLYAGKIQDITYTPDFTFEYKGTLVIIEAKGFENEIFPLKKKLFRGYLEENIKNSLYFEIYTKKQLVQAIEIIQKL